MSHSLRGVLLILCAAMLWGTTGTAQTFASLSLSAYWVGALRLLVSGGFFLAWLAIRDTRSLAPSALKGLPWSAIMLAAVCMASYNLLFFAAIRATSVAVGTALALGSGPVWAGIFEAIMTRRAPSGLWWAGVCIAVSGLVLATATTDFTGGLTLQGVALCLLSGAAYAVYAMSTKRIVSSAPAAISTSMVFTLAACMALPIAYAIAGTPVVTRAELGVLLWLGIVATGIAYLLFSIGLNWVSSSTGVALALAEPVAAVCFAIVIVGERPGAIAISGLLLVLLGLTVLVRSELKSRSH